MKTSVLWNIRFSFRQKQIGAGFWLEVRLVSIKYNFSSRWKSICHYRISITERYKESFTNGICSSEPKFCDWVEEIFIQNEALVGGKINQLAQNDPYWHQVNLFYLQMEGLKNGLKLRADEDPRYGSTGCEVSTKRT